MQKKPKTFLLFPFVLIRIYVESMIFNLRDLNLIFSFLEGIFGSETCGVFSFIVLSLMVSKSLMFWRTIHP